MNKKVISVSRVLLGIMLVVFGLNKFLMFMPMEPANENAAKVFGALMMMNVLPVVALIEIVAGILLLINKQVPVTLLVLAPVAFNATLFHASLDISGIGGSVLFILLTIVLIIANKDKYATIFK